MALLNNENMKKNETEFNATNLKNKSQEIEKHVGKKIKLFRQLRGLSQSEIAVHLGITFQQFQKYESGKNRIPISRLMKLAEIFNINMTVFFENSVNVMFEDIMNKTSNHLNEDILPIEVTSAKVNNFQTQNNLTHDEDTVNLIKNFNLIKDAGVKKHILMLVKSLSEEKIN